ncbi:MAG TPA: hypothetical protein VFJ57_06390 [Solirubrobacterales bacterium]|nr:hypothetical protein [Solirubrobacterales bacterium]
MLIILGGSSPWTVDLIERLEPDAAVLVGRDSAALVALRRFLRKRSRTKVELSRDPRRALEEASVVLCQARIGGWPGRREDEFAPLTWGAYGDETLGIGGLRSALRASTTLAEWASYAPDAPTVMLSNPTDLLTRWWQSHSRAPTISVCEAPTELMLGLPPGSRYLGVNHLGWALTPEGQRIPSRWLPLATNPAGWVRRRSRTGHRADELRILSQALKHAIAAEDHERFDALIKRRVPRWYEAIVVPVLRSLLDGTSFRGIVGLPNDGVLPAISRGVIVERLTNLMGAGGELPEELVQEVSTLAHSRQLAWEVMLDPTEERLARYTEADPFSTGARYPADLLSWIVGA